MIQKDNIIIADEGKEFRRIEDGMIYGDQIALGYSYYIGGIKLDEPHKDVPEDFEEIDKPIEEPEEPIEESVEEPAELIENVQTEETKEE